MATLTAAKAASTVQARANIGETILTGEYEISAALALNDVIQMVKVPAGFTVCEVILVTDDLDSNGSPALVLDVGDDGDVDRFIDGATIGQTGGIQRMNEVDGFLYEYSAENTIDVLVQVGPATGATSGTIRLVVIGTMAE